MLFDFSVAADRLRQNYYDVCICGAGPAGITIARKLARSGQRVALLEAGGLEQTEQSQGIYEGQYTGIETYYGLTNCRLRYFGGTSNHWSGMCGILDELDFLERDFFEMSNWPITRPDILAGLEEARDILDLGEQKFDTPQDPWWLSSSLNLRPTVQSPPTRFSEKYLSEITQSTKIDLFLNANVTNILLNNSLTAVSRLVVKNYLGLEGFVKANKFVLALGAIENSRILLNSDTQVLTGIGNHADLVGRCFMEHPNAVVGRFIETNEEFWRGRDGEFRFKPTQDFALAEDIGNGLVTFARSYPSPKFGGRLKAIREAFHSMECGLRDLSDLSAYLFDQECEGDGVVLIMSEQTPDRESRVTLSGERDELGLRRPILNFRINDKDRHTIRVLAGEAAKEMARLDLARVRLKDYIIDETVEIADVTGNCHHMGTTRMSANPKFGVVDPNCCVHGIGNLYVAGGSVFPRGGFTNPTLTIVLMSLRLAGHLA